MLHDENKYPEPFGNNLSRVTTGNLSETIPLERGGGPRHIHSSNRALTTANPLLPTMSQDRARPYRATHCKRDLSTLRCVDPRKRKLIQNPKTVTGTRKVRLTPLPSCPQLLSPQHCIEPPLSTAQLWSVPAAAAIALETPVTATGTELFASVLSKYKLSF